MHKLVMRNNSSKPLGRILLIRKVFLSCEWHKSQFFFSIKFLLFLLSVMSVECDLHHWTNYFSFLVLNWIQTIAKPCIIIFLSYKLFSYKFLLPQHTMIYIYFFLIYLFLNFFWGNIYFLIMRWWVVNVMCQLI